MDSTGDGVELWYDSTLVGRVSQVVLQDGVSLGVIHFAVEDGTDPLLQELLRYIDFCIDWNERTRTQRDPPSASEFDAFGPIVKSGKWLAKAGDSREAIEDAPVFFAGNEVSWRAKLR
jgi:hypothetical protein